MVLKGDNDLPWFDAMPPDLQLLVYSAEELKIAIGKIAGSVTGPVKIIFRLI